MNDVTALDANKALVIRFLEYAAAYRAEECLALMSADATWWVIGNPSRLRVSGTKDRAQIARLLAGLAKLIPQPMDLSILGITAEGSRVAVEAESSGIWRNGSEYHNRYHFLFEVVKGLIVSLREYMDTLCVFDIVEQEAAAKPSVKH
jgi:ketosteroid isomerase-like protein